MTLEVSELVTKARRSLAAASMFYAAEALLLRRNMSFSRHARVIAALHREYVTSGELSRENHAALQRAFNDRNVADYDAPGVIGEVAEETLRATAAFLDATDALLGRS